MVSAAGALDSEGGKGQEAMEAMDMDSSKPTKKIPRNKFVIAYAVLASTISILFGYVGMGPVNWVLGAEIFPLRLRAKAGSLGVAVERGMSGVLSMTFFSISKAMTVRRMFYLLLAVSALCLIFLYNCVPESFRVKPQEYLDRGGIPVKAETGGVFTGGAVIVTGGAVNVTGVAVNATGGAVNAARETVTGGAVNVTAGAVTVTAGAVNATGGAVTRWLVTGGVLTGGAVKGGAGEAVTGREVRGTVVIGGVLTGGAVTGGAVNVTGGAQEGQ